jgi:hypothetical protein
MKLRFDEVGEVIVFYRLKHSINAKGSFFDFNRFELIFFGIIRISANQREEALWQVFENEID